MPNDLEIIIAFRLFAGIPTGVAAAGTSFLADTEQTMASQVAQQVQIAHVRITSDPSLSI